MDLGMLLTLCSIRTTKKGKVSRLSNNLQIKIPSLMEMSRILKNTRARVFDFQFKFSWIDLLIHILKQVLIIDNTWVVNKSFS